MPETLEVKFRLTHTMLHPCLKPPAPFFLSKYVPCSVGASPFRTLHTYHGDWLRWSLITCSDLSSIPCSLTLQGEMDMKLSSDPGKPFLSSDWDILKIDFYLLFFILSGKISQTSWKDCFFHVLVQQCFFFIDSYVIFLNANWETCRVSCHPVQKAHLRHHGDAQIDLPLWLYFRSHTCK